MRPWHDVKRAPGAHVRGLFGIGRVMSTSSALRFPFTVSERPGDDTGVLGGTLSDAPLA
jgi:hypothetical protein